MKKFKTLLVEKEGKVVTVTLNREESKNAISVQLLRDLTELMDLLEDIDDIAVVVLKGDERAFCSGIDLRDFTPGKPPDIYGFHKWEKMCRRLERLNKITVAVIEGACIGGGVQLALVCDIRIATRNAWFQLNEVKLGFLPGLATFRLAKYIGIGRAKEVILTGRKIKASEAKEMGLIERVCDPLELEQILATTIEEFLPFNPVSLELARRLLNESYATTYENFVGHFLAAQHRAILSDAFRDLVLKAHEKDKPN